MSHMPNDRLDRSSTISSTILAAISIFAVAVRFFALESSPPGFYRDEAAIAAQIICVRQSWTDLDGIFLPAFSPALGGGFVSPPFLYFGVIWTSIFGDSVFALRSIASLAGALTVIGVFFLAQILFGCRGVAWFSALCCSISPWGFLQSRIAWDPAIAPALFVWSAYFLVRGPGHSSLLCGMFGGILGALACYAYPPMRLQALLVFPAIMLLLQLRRREMRIHALAFITSGIVAAIPLLKFTLTGELQSRVHHLAIWKMEDLEAGQIYIF